MAVTMLALVFQRTMSDVVSLVKELAISDRYYRCKHFHYHMGRAVGHRGESQIYLF